MVWPSLHPNGARCSFHITSSSIGIQRYIGSVSVQFIFYGDILLFFRTCLKHLGRWLWSGCNNIHFCLINNWVILVENDWQALCYYICRNEYKPKNEGTWSRKLLLPAQWQKEVSIYVFLSLVKFLQIKWINYRYFLQVK